MKKVSIQGVRGAFHEEAAKAYFNEEIEIVPTLLFKNLVKDVAEGVSNMGIIAVENTLSGTIHQNLNLIQEFKVSIVGEQLLRIKQNLGVFPGVKLTDLTEVRSHYMAINQSREFFEAHPHISLIDDIDTALSAKMVAEKQLKTTGAIGSIEAMKLYNLEVLAEGIETNKLNYTRFLIISKNGNEGELINKATVNLMLPNKTGSLSCLLAAIHKAEINLTKIESVPIVGQPWHYQFYLDMEFEDAVQEQNAEKVLQKHAEKYYILGKYLRHDKAIE